MKRVKLFFWVIFFQIFILNNIQFSGYINPYYYIIFILAISNKTSKSTSLLLAFLIGFIIDIFSNSYGIHSFASVLIAYLTPRWIKAVNRIKDSDEIIEINNLSMRKFLILSASLVLIHHFTLFLLESFSFKNMFYIIQSTFISAFFTLILLIIHKFFSAK